MIGNYNSWLVFLSIVVATFASYVALDLASRVVATHGTRSSSYWLFGGALSMGTGIWSMHFIGMLAFQLPIPMSYDIPITLGSLLIAVIVSGFALYTISHGDLSLRRLLGAGLLMGIGIASMHYTGMAAMQLEPPVRYDPPLFTASVVVAIVASVGALWIAFQLRTEKNLPAFWKKAGSALVMGFAIAGMHYTGMASAIFAPDSVCTVSPQEVNNVWLAGAIGSFAFMFLVATLLISVFDARTLMLRALGASEARFRSLTELSSDWYWEQDAELRFVATQGVSDARGGITPAAHIGKRRWELPSTEILNQTWDEHKAVLGARQPFRDLMLCRTDSRGEAHFVAVAGKPMFDAQGTFCGYHGVASDVTARMRAEDDLRRFRLAMDSSADMMGLVDRASMKFVDINKTMCTLLGYTRDELLQMRLSDLLPVSEAELAAAYDRQIANPSVPGGMKSYYRCRDGSRLPFESKRQVLRSGDKWLISIVSRDIRERIQAENALRESEARFRALTELSSDLYWETNAEHRISKYAYGAKIRPVVPADQLIGQRRWEIREYVSPDEEGWRAHRATLDAHLPFRDFEAASRGVDGEVRHFALSGEPMFDAGGAFTGYRGVGREITEQKAVQAQLDQLAHYDTLTGLPNRALLHDRMRRAMARADRGQTLLAVMFLDLDRFKEINDTVGHAVGDAVLKEVARRVQSCLRSTDTVARLGGDEFTMLLEDAHDVDEVSAVARKILDAFTEPAKVADRELHLSASIGITLYPLDNQDADALLKNADIAMYQAKQEGRDNFQFFAAEMGKRTERGAGLRLRLHHALERGEFALHYQPQVHATSGRITGLEALLRWTDAEMGPVPPGQFIPIAEETGLIVPIGDWVLREACRQCKSWHDAGLGPLRVAVNLSPRQFRQKKLAQRIGEILRETGLPAACLEIEITEGIVMRHAERAVTTLTELNRVGVQIAIDDFGTGYSSLAYLQRFPVHVLKIDQSFVQAIRGRKDQAPIVNTVIQLAKLLGLKTLAEGVETAEQREYLRVHGCDAFQGYLFCKPQPAKRIGELLAGHRHESASA